MRRFVAILPVILSACVQGAAVPGPVAADLSHEGLVLTYAEDGPCTVAAPAGTGSNGSWSRAPVGCPGVEAVEVVVIDAVDTPVILRVSDGGGDLTVTGFAGAVAIDVWIARPDGTFWLFSGAPQ